MIEITFISFKLLSDDIHYKSTYSVSLLFAFGNRNYDKHVNRPAAEKCSVAFSDIKPHYDGTLLYPEMKVCLSDLSLTIL